MIQQSSGFGCHFSITWTCHCRLQRTASCWFKTAITERTRHSHLVGHIGFNVVENSCVWWGAVKDVWKFLSSLVQHTEFIHSVQCVAYQGRTFWIVLRTAACLACSVCVFSSSCNLTFSCACLASSLTSKSSMKSENHGGQIPRLVFAWGLSSAVGTWMGWIAWAIYLSLLQSICFTLEGTSIVMLCNAALYNCVIGKQSCSGGCYTVRWILM